ncbi:MAG TPA: hypothetical protein V6D20_13560 [Candidatus Obscuribacterales bacterium]
MLHPAGPLLKEYGDLGLPVEVDGTWTMEQLDLAVAYGAHPSARTAEAAECCRAEAMEKVHQGFCKIVPWQELRREYLNGATNTKISPIAAIPHKSRKFRMLLDLSEKARRTAEMRQAMGPTVNEATHQEAAPLESMAQLGAVVPRIIHALATFPTSQGPIVMAKLDIKDGFWRLGVDPSRYADFCYLLPKLDPQEDTMVVVPTAPQMGWTSSPAFFGAATETGRDLAEWFRLMPSLPQHPMEHAMIDPVEPNLLSPLQHPSQWDPKDLPLMRQNLHYLLEIFVDDAIGLVQSTCEASLRHYSRALLHAIHQIFPKAPPGSEQEDPISYKKLVLDQEGVWAVRKEILGWLMDGINRTIQLPTKKVDKIQETIRSICRHQHCSLKELQSITGKLQHAALAVPAGRGLLQPLHSLAAHCIKADKQHVQLPTGSMAHTALKEFSTLFTLAGKRPTHCTQLIPGPPAYIGNCDACKHGVGGVWLSHKRIIHPIVWRFKWPVDIVDRVANHTLTINDLEMAGMVLQFLVINQLTTVEDTHLGIWCDNTSAVSWSSKLSSKKSMAGQHLARALSLLMASNKASPLAAMSIAGKNNEMADLASRSFHANGTPGNYNLTDYEFLTKFNSQFPLPQGNSWKMFRLSTKLTSLVCQALRQQHVLMGGWLRLPTQNNAIGEFGSNTATDLEWTPISKGAFTRDSPSPAPGPSKLPSSAILPLTYAQATEADNVRYAMAQSKKHWLPSARNSCWIRDITPYTRMGLARKSMS